MRFAFVQVCATCTTRLAAYFVLRMRSSGCETITAYSTSGKRGLFYLEAGPHSGRTNPAAAGRHFGQTNPTARNR
jgi:hypothetical protein